MKRQAKDGGNLLCVANFPRSTGYAWDFIHDIFDGLATKLSEHAIETWVAYPEGDFSEDEPRTNGVKPVVLRSNWRSLRDVLQMCAFIRRRRIVALYLSDRPTWNIAYLAFRCVGVRRIVVHDHTSGEFAPSSGFRGMVKRLSRRLTWAMADQVVAVSEYVRQRKLTVDRIPPDRVSVLLNFVSAVQAADPATLRQEFGIPEGAAVVVCSCRAAEYKGVHHLLDAFEMVSDRIEPSPYLIYFGSGPYLEELQRVRSCLASSDRVILAGYRTDARALTAGADLSVVPSTWAEAFGLAAAEPLAAGVPVVACRVGGLPEVVLDGETGLLVPPADPASLAEAITSLLADPERRLAMGLRGKAIAASKFSRNRYIDSLSRLFLSHALKRESADAQAMSAASSPS